jgi:formylglycine-generating enzyme required for sulfatase activity
MKPPASPLLLALSLVLLLAGCDSGSTGLQRGEGLLVPEKTEVTVDEWLRVREWANANGYDLPLAGTNLRGGDPVTGIDWRDAVLWCNAKSAMEGLTPVYVDAEGAVLTARGAAPLLDPEADGHRLPTAAEWEEAATQATRLGLRGMDNKVLEWCWDGNAGERVVGGGRPGRAPLDGGVAAPGLRTVRSTAGAAAPRVATAERMDFPDTLTSGTSELMLDISNPGGSVLRVDGVVFPGDFSGSIAPFEVAPGETAQLMVSFAPKKTGASEGLLILETNALDGNAEVVVAGTGQEPAGQLVIEGATDFGDVPVGGSEVRELVFRNTGGVPLHIGGITLPEGFGGTCSGSIPPDGERAVRITFSPLAVGPASGDLLVDLTEGRGADKLALTGTGAPPPPAPEGMALVLGGVLPEASGLAGQSVEPFLVKIHETTLGEWRAVADWAADHGYAFDGSAAGGGPNHPVRGITWRDAVKWCNARSEVEGLQPVYLVDGEVFRSGDATPVADPLAGGYRLPGEAEWEWAARGGIASKGFPYSGGTDPNAVAWHWDNATASGEDLADGRGTAPVGGKDPNELGLHDMSGNVAEWTWTPAGEGARRVRGGAWLGAVEDCSPSHRAAADEDFGADFLGFRFARNLPPADEPPTSKPDGAPEFVTPRNLPPAKVGEPYEAKLLVERGSPPNTFATAPGVRLPQGLELAEDGTISGTPAVTGTHAFEVEATDSGVPVRGSVSRTFTLAVAPYGLSIGGGDATIPATYNEPLEVAFEAIGGQEPNRWSTVEPLPRGLSLDSSTGLLSGSPQSTGNPTITLRVRDAAGFTAMRPFSLAITADPLEIAGADGQDPVGVAGLRFSWTAAVDGGVPPYKASPAEGTALPEGTTLALAGANATVAGIPPAAGSFPFAIEATDAAGERTVREFTLEVEPYDLAVAAGLAKPVRGKFNELIASTLTAAGGKPPYRWSVEGDLPRGVSLDGRNGTFNGKPSVTGEFPVVFTVTDANNLSASRKSVISITAYPLKVMAGEEETPEGTAGLAFSTEFLIEGGVPPYTVEVDSLPEGMEAVVSGSTARLSGKAATPGTHAARFRIVDADGTVAAHEASLTVAPYDLAIADSSSGDLPAKFAAELATTLEATGGKPPYRWEIEGDLPPGTYFNSYRGSFSGKPRATGSFPIGITVTDANSVPVQASAILVVSADPLVIAADGEASKPVAGLPFSAAFTVEGGVPPFSLATDGLPDGIEATLRGSSVRVSGTPAEAASVEASLTVTDADGTVATRPLSLKVVPYDLEVVRPPAKALAGKFNEPLEVALEAKGGKPPYRWTVDGDLPPGISLSPSTGAIRGTPRNTGSFRVEATVTDGNRLSASRAITLKVKADALEISLPGDEMPKATAGLPVAATLEINGGVPPYKVDGEGAAPDWLDLTVRGGDLVASGTPPSAGKVEIPITVLDANGAKAAAKLALEVAPYDLALAAPAMAEAKPGAAFELALDTTGGKPPYRWSAEGSLPPGLRLATSQGSIAGTPSDVGEFPLTVEVKDANGMAVSTNLTISVASEPLVIGEAAPPPAREGAPYKWTVPVTGGFGPPTVAAAPDSTLPPGLALRNGVLEGKPSATGVFPLTVTASDSKGATAEGTFQLVVEEYGLEVSGPAQASGREEEELVANFNAIGGEPPYRWALEGPVPTGVAINPANGVLAGTPAKGSAGTRTITVVVTDKLGIKASSDVELLVTPPPAESDANLVLVEGGTMPAASPMAGAEIATFLLARHETTWGEWKAVRARASDLGYDIADAGQGDADNHPVRNISWQDAVKWCNLRSELEGLEPVYKVDGEVLRSGGAAPTADPAANGHRLPTEAEWEWAARGGKASGGFTFSGGDSLDEVAWHAGNTSGGGTNAVGSKKENELGLFDMSGNVREWCWDEHKSYRRFRGGGFNDDAYNCNVAGSDFNLPTRGTPDCGFRTARNPVE